MNKIIMNNSISNQDNIKIIVFEDTEYTIMNQSLKTLDIVIKNSSEVIINDFRIIDQENTNIKIKVKDKSSLIYNHSFINNNKYELNIDTDYQTQEAKIILNIHGINNQGKSIININGNMSNKKNNVLLENIKLINLNNGWGTIIPNIKVETSQIIANHQTSIGIISKEELSYLMSKGISKEDAKKLILTGFLINIFKNKNLITKIKEIINWR